MVYYHGSSVSGLKTLEYAEDFSRFGGDANLLHGAGIYLTDTENEAMAYATSSLYKVQVNGSIFDTTDTENLEDFVKNLFHTWGVDPDNSKHPMIQSIILSTSRGDISGVGFPEALFTVISNESDLYHLACEVFDEDIDKVNESVHAQFYYKLIKVRHKGNGTNWIICLDHSGYGLEILEEITV